MRLAWIALAAAVAAAGPARAQFSGNLQPGQILGNPGSTPAPARAMDMSGSPASPFTVGPPAGTAGTVKAPGSVLHQSQGSTLTMPSNLAVDADYISIRSADPSLTMNGTITGTAAAGNTPGVRYTLNYPTPGSVFDSRTAPLAGGETNAVVATRICNAIVANTALIDALAHTLDGLGQGSGSPFQNGCSGQVVGNVMTFNAPWISGIGNTASALNSGGITVTIQASGGGAPATDNGPVFSMMRSFPTGYDPAGGLGPLVGFLYNINGTSTYGGFIKTVIGTPSNKMDLRIGTNQAGSFLDRIGVGQGIYTLKNGALCAPDPGDGSIASCGYISKSVTGLDNLTIMDTTSANRASTISLRHAGAESILLQHDGNTNFFYIYDPVNAKAPFSYSPATQITSLGGGTGKLTVTNLPASAGAGGLALCVDTAGVIYKKASCP